MNDWGTDRRRKVRFGTSGWGTFSILDPAFPAEEKTGGRFLLEDVSVRGVRIETEDLTNEQVEELVGGRLVMAVVLDDVVGEPVRGLALVRWARPVDDTSFRLGMEFAEMAEEHVERLRAFLFQLLSSAGVPVGEPSHALRRALRKASPFLVGAAAVILGVVVGHFASYRRAPAEPAPETGQLARARTVVTHTAPDRRIP